MTTSPNYLAISTSSSVSFINYLITNHTLRPNTHHRPSCKNKLMICMSRDDFIAHIFTFIRHEQHTYIQASIALITAASDWDVIYAPSLMHVRAFISGGVLRGTSSVKGKGCGDDGGELRTTVEVDVEANGKSENNKLKSRDEQYESGGGQTHPPVLAIYNLTNSHDDSGELTAQGVARTLASLVDSTITSATNTNTNTCTPPQIIIQIPPSDPKIGLVNKTMMRKAFGGDGFEDEQERRWSVPISGVVGRWFQIAVLEEEDDDVQEYEQDDGGGELVEEFNREEDRDKGDGVYVDDHDDREGQTAAARPTEVQEFDMEDGEKRFG